MASAIAVRRGFAYLARRSRRRRVSRHRNVSEAATPPLETGVSPVMPDDHEHDRRLAARAGAGDERAFDELVERHRDPLLRYVARRFRPELAEDAVQEALLSAHRALIGGTAAAGRARVALHDRLAAGAGPRPPRARCAAAGLGRRRLQGDRRAGGAGDPGQRARPRRRRVVGAARAPAHGPDAERARGPLAGGDRRCAATSPADTAKSLVARSRRTLDAPARRRPSWTAARRAWRWSRPRRAACAWPARSTLHLESCRGCARAHRVDPAAGGASRALVPFGLIVRTAGLRDKLRDLIAFNPGVGGADRRGEDVHGGVPDGDRSRAGAVAAPTVSVVVPIVAKATADAARRPASRSTAEAARSGRSSRRPRRPQPGGRDGDARLDGDARCRPSRRKPARASRRPTRDRGERRSVADDRQAEAHAGAEPRTVVTPAPNPGPSRRRCRPRRRPP